MQSGVLFQYLLLAVHVLCSLHGTLFHAFKAVIAETRAANTLFGSKNRNKPRGASSHQLGSTANVTSRILQPTQALYARAVAFAFNGYIYILPVRIMHRHGED